MGSNRDVVILADDIDILVGCVRNYVDLGIAYEKVRHHIAHRELHGGDRRGAAHGAGRFVHPLAYGGLSQLGLTQHHHCVAIEFLAGVSDREPPGGAIEQPDPKVTLELLNTVAQRRLRNS